MAQKTYTGIGVSEGVRIAKAYVYLHPVIDTEKDIAPSEADAEAARFQAAVKAALDEVDGLIARSAEVLGKDKVGVLKGQKAILADPAYVPEIEKLIRKKNASAEKAVKQITDQFAAIFAGMSNAYMKERAADVRDAGTRLLGILAGVKSGSLSEIDREVILISDDLSPSDTIQLNQKFVLGFATERGGKTAHTSIFAKSMGLPAVVGVPELLGEARDGDTIILDGAQGICILDPDAETVKTYKAKYKKEQEQQAIFETFSKKQAVMSDGTRIITAVNIGNAKDAEIGAAQGAEAVGLMRTELLFLSGDAAPTEEEQFAEYKKIAETFAGSEPGDVIIRTLDIGGDKEVQYLDIPKEENPFLGYRAIRLCLDRKDLFLTQLRALLRASAFGKLKIMFPMISGYQEVLDAKAVLAEAKAQLDVEQVVYDRDIKVGVMIEVPSAALMADVLAEKVDFFSIGTNDLVQYSLAVDRGNRKIAYLYDYFNPAVIRLIRQVAKAAKPRNVLVGMCGGMAGDPLAVPLLVGLGLDELSMAAGAIPQTKYILSKVDLATCQALAASVADCKTPQEVRVIVTAFAEKYGLL
ncbi:phosphoenolpyruvate--protein phosphotransferase [Ethanoligenens harbinense]|uniref:Phosphoenolpyruvate-protein phosphotransferase n=1 Tax=Ethanoligenens harbinense (strain DSM 18485 / JCM 12961 / CGMCC 1.5033 / YUAN-3) TaxID=663278 RepID=E6U7J8_ETHHY|nr:phosphoenolpyruvate--protein phosphotransferase [Ethanoligenens harbinense]ADU27021.1 phosphoenolpyruvate-protein phosphotransferase [Ethanoligenens harbinense YUAN-3]AVQ96108.1 phosphoenolpyruvate--protein phosphotransferase [Ethanoligenens harbinense YUAN-3]AYF41517.1 phosphoenolpyruvate--protein phosphotransferase [Ethanoligenens harbinense]QCN92349.1 phosphoenolpyruvate--protein phosphotransferase [Ethanoligenens harbinense]